MLERALRAARLDDELYEEIEDDSAATFQALWVVIFVGVAASLWALSGILPTMEERNPGVLMMLVAMGTTLALVVWVLAAFVAYLIGTRLFRGSATHSQLLRATGLASAPAVLLLVAAFLPQGLQVVIILVAAGWVSAAVVVAVRETLGVVTGVALFLVAVGALVGITVVQLIGSLLTGGSGT